MRNDVLVQVKDLYKYYPVGKRFFSRGQFVHAVDGVDLEISQGETFGLVGESGCGKSTLGRVIIGLDVPTQGKVIFEGKIIHEQRKCNLRDLRRQMQIVFQDPYSSLNPRKTVGGIIGRAFAIHNLGNHSDRQQRVAELLEMVGLRPDDYKRYPHEFSGGQRQRICIARALALNPKFIIADEPVASLDVSIQGQIINLFQDLQDRYHFTYMFISHDLSLVKHISDRVAVMYLGKIVESAESSVLFRDPQHPYTQALLSAIPQVIQTRKEKRILLEGDVPSPINPPSGCRFHTRCPYFMGICKEIEPPLNEGSSSHRVACHLHHV